MFHKWLVVLMTIVSLLIFGCNISGKVTTVDGDGIENVLVTLTGNGETATTYTDAQGQYEFAEVALGMHVVCPTKEDLYFLPVEKKVMSGASNANFKQNVGVYKKMSLISAAWTPTDLTLYESLLPEPLEMPDQPTVLVFVGDMLETIVPEPLSAEGLREGVIALRCEYDGEDAWYSLYAPHNNILAVLVSLSWGFPGVFSNISFEETGPGWETIVPRMGKDHLKMDFTPDEGVDISGLIDFFQLVDPYLDFPPPGGQSLTRYSLRDCVEPTWEWEPGVVEITFDSSDSWSGLLPPGGQSDGAFCEFNGGREFVLEADVWVNGE